MRFAPLLLSAALASVGFNMSTCRGSADGPASSNGGGGPPAVAEVAIPGVDTSAFTPRERREWTSYVSDTLSPCPNTPVSIAQCIREKRDCPRCLPAAKFLASEVHDGVSREMAVEAFRARFDNDRVKNIDTSDTPERGPQTAPVTVVEWADFECPFCKRAAPILDEMVDRFPGKVRVLFKFYPLNIHQHSMPAARAAVAAMMEGKFWEMHHKLFQQAPALEDTDLDKYAEELGLKASQFKSDRQGEASKARVERDMKQADALGLQGTPLIYINGREFESKGDFRTALEDWIHDELQMQGIADDGKRPAPTASVAAPPAPSSSAAPKSPPSSSSK